jgi:hypothetical protein
LVNKTLLPNKIGYNIVRVVQVSEYFSLPKPNE